MPLPAPHVWLAAVVVLASTCAGNVPASAPSARPNIVFILADDLGYGDLGCYGQTRILTPNTDRLAAEGMRFTQFYAGASVCAPSRCVLMTGKHTGHCRVRGNAPLTLRDRQTLTADDRTVAALLKRAGYATALVGKWGLGMDDMSGHPLHQGFDLFFGYLDQVHAHNFFPDYVWRNRDKVMLPNEVRPILCGKDGMWGTSGIARRRVVYSPKLMLDEALASTGNITAPAARRQPCTRAGGRDSGLAPARRWSSTTFAPTWPRRTTWPLGTRTSWPSSWPI